MKKSLLFALLAVMPVLAQECPNKPACCFGKMNRPQLSEEQKAEMKAKFEARKAEMLAKFDADKDGKLSDDERKAAFEARKAEMKARFMEKFDADKDGQLSDAEKEAVKAEFEKNAPKFHKRGHRGPKPCCRHHRGQRPQLSEEQKAEMKAKFEAHKAEMKARFMEKFDADKDGQLSDAEKEAVKAEFKKNAPKFHKRGHRGPKAQRPCCGKCMQK